MRALVCERFGQPLRLREVEDPRPEPGEVLLEVEYASVNPLDVWVCAGQLPAARTPLIPGVEGSGRVGGRPVVAHGHGLGIRRDGTYAQRAAVPAAACIALPDEVDLAQAAALGVAGVTAWRLVHEVAPLGPDDRVLVLGASGGVGSLLLQLASAAGAEVWGQTSSPAKAAAILEDGAHDVWALEDDGLADARPPLTPTVVFDPLGDGYTALAVRILETGGRLALFGTSAGSRAELELRELYRKGLSLLGYSGLASTPEQLAAALRACIEAVAAGRLRVRIDEVLPLERGEEAHKRIRERRVRGKLLLRP
jgi:NADPH:quinone reductase